VVAGFSTFSVTKQVLEGSTIIDTTTLEPNMSFEATMKNLPSGQQLLFSLSSNPSDVPMQAQITQPNGTLLATFEINKTPFSSTATTKISGDHMLSVKNIGSKPVTVNGAILNSPVAQQGGGVGVKDDASLQSFIVFGIGILIGIILIIAGIVILIIGAVKYFRGKRAAPQGS